MKNKSVKSRTREMAARSSDATITSEHKTLIFKAYERAASGFGKSHIVAGAGTVFDLGGSYLSAPELGTLNQDAEKIRNDFSAISSDFKNILSFQLKGIS